jgi:hypothetical protein
MLLYDLVGSNLLQYITDSSISLLKLLAELLHLTRYVLSPVFGLVLTISLSTSSLFVGYVGSGLHGVTGIRLRGGLGAGYVFDVNVTIFSDCSNTPLLRCSILNSLPGSNN